MRRRRKEVAVRIANGATPRLVVSLFMRQGIALMLSGIAAGLALHWASLHYLRSVIVAVGEAGGSAVWLAVAAVVVVAGVGLAANLVPALRAMRTDSSVLLREDA